MLRTRRVALLGLALCTMALIAWFLLKPDSPPTKGDVTIQWETRPEGGAPIVLFIHGIGGDAIESWREGTSPTFMELLAKEDDFKSYGIGTVNYPTALFGPSRQHVASIAVTLASEFDRNFSHDHQIIIVAHSQGGILARCALARSKFAERQHQFISLITLASPFKGSRLPDMTRRIGGLPSLQLEALRTASEAEDLHRELWNILLRNSSNRITQFAAYETRGLGGVDDALVVTKDSATEGVDPARIFHAEDDHSSIAKPATLTSGIGKQVATWIRAATGHLILRGNYSFATDLVRPAGTVTIIGPGSTLSFSNGASMIAYGKVDSRDTEFRFGGKSATSQDGPQPPGAIMLYGPDCDDSTFASCRFIGGGGVHIDKPDAKGFKDYPAGQIFEPLRVQRRATASAKGGAMCIVLAHRVRFINCLFQDNHAWIGGAVTILGADNTTFNKCRFEDNTSKFGGGALYAQVGEVFLVDCAFERNSTGTPDPGQKSNQITRFACGGALYIGERGYLNASGCGFVSNSAANAGGALYMFDCLQGVGQVTRASIISTSSFTDNICNLKEGGAVRIDGMTQVNLVDIAFSKNTSPDSVSGADVWDESDINPAPDVRTSGVAIDSLSRSDEPRNLMPGAWSPSTMPPSVVIHDNLILRRSAFREATGRYIDSIVVHHISAIKWFDDGFQSILTAEGITATPERAWPTASTKVGEYKFRSDLCKTILEAYNTSAHYLIDRDGTIQALVRESNVAFHAGHGIMPEGDDRLQVNEFSIGIEIIACHPEDDEDTKQSPLQAYTAAQYDSLHRLLTQLCLKYVIHNHNIVGHDAIAGERAVAKNIRALGAEKRDPGPLFDWDRVRGRLATELASYPAYSPEPR